MTCSGFSVGCGVVRLAELFPSRSSAYDKLPRFKAPPLVTVRVLLAETVDHRDVILLKSNLEPREALQKGYCPLQNTSQRGSSMLA